MAWRISAILAFLCALADWAGAAEIGPHPYIGRTSAAAYEKSKGFSVREDGILVFDYGKKYGGLGKWANPYFVSKYAHFLYGEWLENKDEDKKRRFLIQADYLLHSAVQRGESLVWIYPFRNHVYDLAEGWISGIGQSWIAGVLARAHALTGRSEYRDAAEKAMSVYLKPLEQGGVITIVGDTIWIEEAPDHSGHSFKILNGHISALTGVLDYYRITGASVWKDIFDKGVDAVRQDIADFDIVHTSLYALGYVHKPLPAPVDKYHLGHVLQLLWLADVTGDEVFVKWASRFLFNKIDPFNRSDVVRYAPIVDRCNFDAALTYIALVRGKGEYLPSCDGWLIFQRGTATEVAFSAGGPGALRISVADRFGDWKEVATVKGNATVPLPFASFVRVSFTKNAGAIVLKATKGQILGHHRSLYGDVAKALSIAWD
ncbi:MAG: D-glucuronyl C5-epimerase family protein [Hyphomicrobium sp.]|uniref:D-glucuronyl C5-epimerase family protein n=1 Tax=Hyphomicrobium sp. TaxID=82 RepID=UPI003D113A96